MKKFSLIVALMIALTVIFISCGADYDPPPPPPPPEGETFIDVDLGTTFNYFAGQPDNQAGWATDGQSEIDKTVGKLGLKAEDFQTAKYLVIEVKAAVDVPAGITLIWGGEPSSALKALGVGNPGWNDKPVVVGGKGEPGTTVAGKKITIELAKALNRYDAFSDPSVTELKLVVQSWNAKIAEFVDKAYLQISSLPPEFFPATAITVNPITGKLARTNIQLTATITPKGTNTTTSVQAVTWEIVGGLAYPADVDFAYSTPVGINSTKLPDTIFVSKTGGGKVKVRATLKNGGEDADKNKIDVVSDVYEIVVGANPYPATGLITKSDVVPNLGANINNFFKTADATTYPKFAVIAILTGAGGLDWSAGGSEDPDQGFQLAFNGGGGANTGDAQSNRYSDTGKIKISSADADGFVYLVYDLTKWQYYTTYMSDHGWGLQFESWKNKTLLTNTTNKIFLIKSSVTSLTKPAGSVDFTGSPVVGYVANKLPVELDWE